MKDQAKFMGKILLMDAVGFLVGSVLAIWVIRVTRNQGDKNG